MSKPLPTPEQMRKSFRYNFCTGAITHISGKPAFTTKHGGGYLCGVFMGKRIYAHRAAIVLATGEWPEHDVDHIDMDRTNNRWRNLREATRSENMANSGSRKGSQSRYKGVCPDKGRWRAYIAPNGKQRHLGLFDDETEAARAYDTEARKVFGPHARTNF